jgi:hypothetical protein
LVNDVASAAIQNNNSQGIAGFEIKPTEHAEDRASRIKRQEADATFRRIKELVFFAVCLLLVVGIFLVAAKLVSDPKASPDDKKWATAVLSSIVTSTIAFLAGKSSRDDDKK